MNDCEIEITEKRAKEEISHQMLELSEKLTELAILLKNGSTKEAREGILATIKTWKWVPELILTLINLTHALP